VAVGEGGTFVGVVSPQATSQGIKTATINRATFLRWANGIKQPFNGRKFCSLIGQYNSKVQNFQALIPVKIA
jgi:hypothetical protein